MHRSYDVEGPVQHNLKLCRCIDRTMWRGLGSILCDLDPDYKVKVKVKKASICNGTAALFLFYLNILYIFPNFV